ncbi:hypothetical protein [uncultured Tateyamaria sp.]|uniref:hypothetical protein n=1 Tax=uncultured Tateyamaria sp. TaxID=455651 RepID=UPI002621215C|nr:hypothetical protein [uncultured Tateyamaria sp.]
MTVTKILQFSRVAPPRKEVISSAGFFEADFRAGAAKGRFVLLANRPLSNPTKALGSERRLPFAPQTTVFLPNSTPNKKGGTNGTAFSCAWYAT